MILSLHDSTIECRLWIEEKDDVATFDRIKGWLKNIDQDSQETILSVSKYTTPDDNIGYFVVTRRYY